MILLYKNQPPPNITNRRWRMIEIVLMAKGVGFTGACYGLLAKLSRRNSIIFFGSLGLMLVGSLL